MIFDPLLATLEVELRTNFTSALAGLIANARIQLEDALIGVAKERAKGLTEAAEERTKGLAEVATQKAELRHEIETMQTHVAQQEGHVELNIGGHRFQTSVQTLRRVPHTFFDAYFSGRYAQDVCLDGSIFVDRDGEHFGHVLEYMRDGVVSVAAPGISPSLSLLRALKREFGFYCIELVAEEPMEPEQLEIAYVIGGSDAGGGTLSAMERYDASLEQWSSVAAMSAVRMEFGACVVAGNIYVTGGLGADYDGLSSVEKYSPALDAWSAMAPMPHARHLHASVAVGSVLFVLGGENFHGRTASTLKFDCAGTWSEVAPMPNALYGSASCAVGTDIYIFGGNGAHQDSLFKYDTLANEWSTLASMVSCEIYTSATVIGDVVYIVGAGYYGREVLRFDLPSGVCSTCAPTSSHQVSGASFKLNGCLHAISGESGQGMTVQRYITASDTWTEVAKLQAERSSYCAVTVGIALPAVADQNLFDSLIVKALHSCT